jgi:thiol-disulfide isomerase/thioredoxin
MSRIPFFIFFLLIKISVQAQSLDEVMNNYFKKIGGTEKVAQINSSKETSLNWFKSNQNDSPTTANSINVTTISMTPYYRKFTSFDTKGFVTNEICYNDRGVSYGTGDVITKDVTKIKITVCIANDLLKLYKNHRLKYVGEKNLGGNSYYVISKKEDLKTEFFYFNKQTYLLEASQFQHLPLKIDYYRNYSKTNMILQPFVLESYMKDILQYRQITKEFEFNPKINKGIFYFNAKEYDSKRKPKDRFKSIQLKIIESTLYEFIEAHFKDRRVFIDLWATWCAPCKKEFRYYDSSYYDFMDRNDLSLVYLSIDKDTDIKKWETDIGKLGLKGYHARVNDDLMKSLQSIVYSGGVIVIPRYILVDENGKILSTDFKRPSDPMFKQEIEKIFRKM